MIYFKNKKRKRTPMTRNIYLMERNPSVFRFWIAFFFKVREIKIGVAKNSQQREKQIDSGIKGKVVFLVEYRVEAATRTEAQIHKKYKSDSFKPKVNKRGSGETEFFRLSNIQIQEIKSTLSRKSTSSLDSTKWFFFICFILLLFYYFKIISK